MNSFLAIAAMRPFVDAGTVGGSTILAWALTLVMIAVVVVFVVWLVSKFAGPPSIPEPFRWVIWVLVAIALLIFLFAALGIILP